MSKLERCKVCKGSKYVIGMGCMKKDCHVCKKTGFVEVETEQDEKEFLSKSVKKNYVVENKVVKKIDKRSKEYRDQQSKSV